MSVARQGPVSQARWVAAVGQLGEDGLAQLLARRRDVVAAKPLNLADVVERLLSTPGAKHFYERSDRTTRQLLEALCALGTPVTLEALAKALGCAPGALGPVVEHLRLAGMVLVDADNIEASPGLGAAIPYPCRLGPPAHELLSRLSNSELAGIATRLGLPTGGAKPELVKRVARGTADAQRIRTLLASAPEGTDCLVKTAVWDWPSFQLTSGAAAAAGNSHSVPGWCLRHGLLVATGWATAVMPREVALALRDGLLFASFEPSPPTVVARPADPERVDQCATEAALALVADVSSICEAWSALPARVLKDGGLGTREVRRAAKLVGRDEAAAARLIELAGTAGLVGIDEDSATAAPTAAYDEWVGANAPARWACLASAWLNAAFDVGLAGSPDDDGKPVPPLDFEPEPEALVRRALVLDVMASQELGSACDVSSIAAVALWRLPATWENEAEDTSVIVAEVLRDAEMTGMAAMGALSGFGRLLVDDNPEEAEKYLGSRTAPRVDQVVLQADFTATVAGEPTPALRSEMDLLADVESVGHAVVWRISENSVRRAFDAGRDAAAIIAFLHQHAAHGVPQPLSYMVEDVGRRHGLLRAGTASSFVRSEDPALLADLVRAKKTARLGLRLLAPTVAVSARPAGEVIEVMRGAGYLPVMEGPAGEIVPQKRAAHRAEPLPWARAELASAGVLDDLDDADLELLREMMLSDPEVLTALAGLPAGMASMVAEMLSGGSDSAMSPEDLGALASKLLHAPTPPLAALPVKVKRTPARPAGQLPSLGQLFEQFEERPGHIAKGTTEISRILEQADENGWPVRVAYVNSKGMEREFTAEIVHMSRGHLRVRYLDQHGGGELNMRQVQWARVLTEAEEELLG